MTSKDAGNHPLLEELLGNVRSEGGALVLPAAAVQGDDFVGGNVIRLADRLDALARKDAGPLQEHARAARELAHKMRPSDALANAAKGLAAPVVHGASVRQKW